MIMTIVDIIAPELVGGSILMVMCFGLLYLLGKLLQLIGTYEMFRKSGDAGWKALIPFYATYTRFNLYWDKKFFWIHMILLLASGYLGSSATGTAGIIAGLVSLGLIVTSVKICLENARCFGKGAGMTILLILMPWLGTMILGFGNAEFQGKQIKTN